MSRKEKLLARIAATPTDFTWEEMTALLTMLGYRPVEGSGSRIRFVDDEKQKILLHKPHPGNIVKLYVVRDVQKRLVEHGKYGR